MKPLNDWVPQPEGRLGGFLCEVTDDGVDCPKPATWRSDSRRKLEPLDTIDTAGWVCDKHHDQAVKASS